MFRFESKKLTTKTLLGKGYTSTVHPYQDTPKDTEWAVKVIKADSFPKLLSIYQNIASVINIDHENILPIKGIHAEEQKHKGYTVYIKLPRMQSDLASTMEDHIKTKTPLSELSVLNHLRDTLDALEYLHSLDKVHGNIRPSNMLLDDKNKIMLTDADVTSVASNHAETGYSEDRDFYLSPEQLDDTAMEDADGQKSQSDDLWSLGVVILELCLLKPKLISPLLEADKREETIQDYLEKVKAKYEIGLVRVLTRLLTSDQSQRGSAAELLQIVDQLLEVSSQLDRIDLINIGA